MLEQISSNKMFGGWQNRYRHRSTTLQCEMRYSVFVPPQVESKRVPVLYWLSGLTCDDQNFVTKAGAQQYAAQQGVALVCPDTSPRGENVPNDTAWDFAQGAGFYLNASQQPWSKNYRMYDYIVTELPEIINSTQPVEADRCGILGHSMGGHGALVIGLRNPRLFQSVSAFSPICAPSHCPWGRSALTRYLGDDRESWTNYDATELIGRAKIKTPLLVDQGADDEFLQGQLKPEFLEQACKQYQHPLTMNYHSGYDHSYYFIASFIEKHIVYHAGVLSN